MIGRDTSVRVRYLMQDDAKQAAKASWLMESLTVDVPGFVSIVSIVSVVELGWVLTSAYGLTRSQLEQALEALLRTKELVVDRADEVLQALRVFKVTKADLADCLIERSAAGAGCERTMTFDVGAAKGAGMVLIQ
jgi:predicted nucleic-acid-binding protein